MQSDTSDVVANEASKKYKDDTSRSRLSCLQAVVKHLLSSSCTDITRDDIQRELPDTTEKEVQTQMLIAQTLQPYIPDKQNRFVVARQIPLCILANDILRTTGYAKFTRQLFPLPRLSYLNALQANAPSLYHMMTSGPDALLISDFNQKAIDSIEYARSNKHAVFSSIFDMSEITNTCDSYKLKFAYNIQILPGLKTARILGTTTKEHSDLSLKKSLSYTLRIVQDPNIVEQHQKGLAILQAKIINSQQELNKA